MKKLFAPLLALAFALPVAAMAAPAAAGSYAIGLEAGTVTLGGVESNYKGGYAEIDGVKNGVRYDTRFSVGLADEELSKKADVSVGYLAFGGIVGPKVRYLHLDNGTRVNALAMGGIGLYARPTDNVVFYTDALLGEDAVSARIGGELTVANGFALLADLEALEISDEVATIAKLGARFDLGQHAGLDVSLRHYDDGAIVDTYKRTTGSIGITVKF